jgi:hypothetical protein
LWSEEREYFVDPIFDHHDGGGGGGGGGNCEVINASSWRIWKTRGRRRCEDNIKIIVKNMFWVCGPD